jgi:hypothetical protein
MLAATLLAIFLIPVLFVFVERIGGGEKKHAQRGALVPLPAGAQGVHRRDLDDAVPLPEEEVTVASERRR